MTLDLNIWLWGSLIVLGASIIQTITGFGFGLLSVPLLLYIFQDHKAVVLSMALSTCSLFIQVISLRNFVRWKIVWRLILIGFPGLIIGIIVGNSLNTVILKGIVGLALISYVVVQWTLKKRKVKQTNEETTDHFLPKGFYPAGIISGFLTGVAGIPGPPVVAVLVNFLKKDIFQATVVYYFFFEYSLGIISVLFIQKEVNSQLFLAVLSFIPAIIVGNFIGKPIRALINEDNFKRLVFGLLILIGLTSISESIKSFFIK